MKKLVLGMIAVSMMTASAASAQTEFNSDRAFNLNGIFDGIFGGGYGSMSPKQVTEQLDRILHLTDRQYSRVKALNYEYADLWISPMSKSEFKRMKDRREHEWDYRYGDEKFDHMGKMGDRMKKARERQKKDWEKRLEYDKKDWDRWQDRMDRYNDKLEDILNDRQWDRYKESSIYRNYAWKD